MSTHDAYGITTHIHTVNQEDISDEQRGKIMLSNKQESEF